MTIDAPAIIIVFFQITVLTVLLALSVRLIRKSSRSLTAVFLAFLFSIWLITDLYWVIYDFMRPDRRMPFAVNEIGEASLFLLKSALLSTVISWRASSARRQAAGAVLFAAGNAALWIAWSGEWIQDILTGAVFAYFLCSVACSLKIRQLLTKKEWIGLGTGCALLLSAQAVTFFTEPPLRSAVDTGCYVFLILAALYWSYRLFAARRIQAPPEDVLCLALALVGWLVMAKYMSDGTWYLIFFAAETIALVLLYLSVRKAVAEA